MLDSYGRSYYQTYCIDPLLKYSFWKHFHPHVITAIGTLVGISVCLFLAMSWIKCALVALILSGFLDTLDGSLARYTQQASPQGAALDICCDRLVEVAILLGLYLVEPGERAFSVLCMLSSILLCITTFLVVGIFSEQTSYKSFYYSPGLIERTEAFSLFFAMIAWPTQFVWLAPLFSILVFLTAAKRLWQFMQTPKFIIKK